MPIPTITDFTEDQLTKLEFEKARRKAVPGIVLNDDTPYAIVLLRLHPTVTPADYAALKSEIEAVIGIQEASLLVDHKTRPTARLPAGLRQEATVTLDIKLKNIPEPEPEV